MVITVGFGWAADPPNDFSGGESESSRASELLDRHFPGMTGERVTMAARAEAGARAPAARERVRAAIERLDRMPHVSSVCSPYQPPDQISRDGRTAFATETSEGGSSELVGLLAAVVILLVAFGSVMAMGLGFTDSSVQPRDSSG
jgi:hypothetical protein